MSLSLDRFFHQLPGAAAKAQKEPKLDGEESIVKSSGSCCFVAAPVAQPNAAHISNHILDPNRRREIVSGLYKKNLQVSQRYRDEVVCKLLELNKGLANRVNKARCHAEKKIRNNIPDFFNKLEHDYTKYNDTIDELFFRESNTFPCCVLGIFQTHNDRNDHGPNHGRAVMELVPNIIDGYSKLNTHGFNTLDFETIKTEANLGLIEIATGLHDIARMAHGVDQDEYMNSPMTYITLRQAGCSHAEATLYTFASANKTSTTFDAYTQHIDAVLQSLDCNEKTSLAKKVGLKNNSTLSESDAYLKTYFMLVCRTVGDADTLEIMRCREDFNCEYYAFFNEDPDCAKELIVTAARNLRYGWEGYSDAHSGKPRDQLTVIMINSKSLKNNPELEWFNRGIDAKLNKSPVSQQSQY